MPIRAFLAICWKSRLVCDLKHFDFRHCEIHCASEEVTEGNVIRAHAVTPASANVSETISVCLAVTGNINVTITKVDTVCAIATDSILLLFCPQREFSRQDAVRIPQREQKTPQAVVALPPAVVLPLHRREAAENVPVCIQNQSQSVRAVVAAAVEFVSCETVAAAAPQQIETLRGSLQTAAETVERSPNPTRSSSS
jgi:hypothetical protein